MLGMKDLRRIYVRLAWAGENVRERVRFALASCDNDNCARAVDRARRERKAKRVQLFNANRRNEPIRIDLSERAGEKRCGVTVRPHAEKNQIEGGIRAEHF